MRKPFYVAGTGRFDTVLMEKTRERIFLKIGAEGVYCAAVPELGLGIALKCDDGAGRAAEVMVAAVLARLLREDSALSAQLETLANQPIINRRGLTVGVVRPTAQLT